MYRDLLQERKRFLIFNYTHRDPSDVEDIIKTLYQHFKIINLAGHKCQAQAANGKGQLEILD